jgi:glycosyltransferase involved in cell wall biosynthesis
MKILIVSQYYYPEQFLISEIAPELVKHGHEVTMLTGLPNYPDGIIPKEYLHGHKRDEVINGVRVIRCSEVGRKGGKLNLIRNYISFAASGRRMVRKLPSDVDVIFCYQLSPVTMVIPALSYKKKHDAPLLLYCLDIWPESVQAHVRNDKGWLYWWISKYSKKLYQACDEIAVTSEPFIEYMNRVNGIAADRLCYIPQHADGAMLEMNLKSENNGIADFMFAGNLGKGQKLDTIVKAAAILKKQGTTGFLIHIVGDGSMRQSLELMAEDEDVADLFIFHGQQKRTDMPEYYRKADALLLTLRGNNYVGNTIPGKLQTYMTTGKPIFGAINGDAKQVIEKSECGKCAPAEDSDGLAAIMADYIRSPDNYKGCGDRAKEYFEKHFTLPVFVNRLEIEMTELVSK